MAAAADPTTENPHRFTRDVDIENAAVNLGMTPENVKRMRLESVRQFVQAGIQGMTPENIKRMRLEGVCQTGISMIGHEQHAAAAAAAPGLPTPSAINQDVITHSEIRDLYDTGVFEQRRPVVVLPPPDASMQQVEVQLNPANEPDMKGLEYLMAPINVSTMITHEKDGLVKLGEHINTVLETVGNMEASVRAKKQILMLNRNILNAEDIDDFEQSINADCRRMVIMGNWLRAINQTLNTFMQTRANVVSQVQRIPGNNAALCERMHKRTLQVRALYNVIATRCDCMQIEGVKPTKPSSSSE